MSCNDYVDVNVPVLRRMFAKRAKTYRAMCYAINSDTTASIPLVRLVHSETADQSDLVRSVGRSPDIVTMLPRQAGAPG